MNTGNVTIVDSLNGDEVIAVIMQDEIILKDGYEAMLDVGTDTEMSMDFGAALIALKKGEKLARKGWNGKDMFVVYQRGYPEGIPCNKQTAEAWGLEEGDLFKCESYLQIKMANGSHAMWVPSINDVLSNDWEVVE